MTDLKVIENELVPVYETNTGEKVVYGSELHLVLESKSKFADWVKNRFNDCEAIENEDYDSFSKILEKGGRPNIEYIIKLDIAKEMAMLERNEKGKQVRKYFIDIEKKYKQQQIDTSKLSPELQALSKMISVMAEQELKLNQLEEKTNKVEDKTNKVAETMQTVADTFVNAGEAENFNKWVNASMDRIANSDKFIDIGYIRYQTVKAESYKRLHKCGLFLIKKIFRKIFIKAIDIWRPLIYTYGSQKEVIK